MSLLIELPDAGPKLRNKFSNQNFAESIFRKTTSLGNFNSNGFAVNDRFPSTLNGDPVVRTYDNFTINTGHTVTPVNRCKGMYLFIEGNLTINGILSMTARGANAPGKFIGIDPDREFVYFNEEDIFSQYKIPTIGKEGGLDILNLSGKFGACGAGGAGGDGSTTLTTSNIGATAGTSFSGGSGAGGFANNNTGTFVGYNPEPNGGAGGNGRYGGGGNSGYGGGGAGNPGGIGYQSGQNGTGGLIILFVKGNIIFGPNGKIVSRGSNGGDGRPGLINTTHPGGGGGASGGGAIHLFSKSTDIDISKIDVSGGAGGVGFYNDGKKIHYYYGQNGGNGSVKLYQI